MKMSATSIGEQRCAKCGYKMDQASDAFGEDKPKPGDLSVCLNCGAIAVFGENLQLREPTPEEKLKIAGDESVTHVQVARAYIVDKDLRQEDQEGMATTSCEGDRRVAGRPSISRSEGDK
jgi:hypothetical protein